jgi:hypothetical protein
MTTRLSPRHLGSRSRVEGDKRTGTSSREVTSRMRRSIRPTRASRPFDASVDPTDARNHYHLLQHYIGPQASARWNGITPRYHLMSPPVQYSLRVPVFGRSQVEVPLVSFLCGWTLGRVVPFWVLPSLRGGVLRTRSTLAAAELRAAGALFGLL